MRGSIIKRGKSSYTVVLNLGIDPQTGKRKKLRGNFIESRHNKRG